MGVETKKGKQRPTEINHFRARVEVMASRRQMSLSDVARALGCTRQALMQALDKGMPTVQRGKLIACVSEEALCKVLGITAEELWTDVTVWEYGMTFIPRMTDTPQTTRNGVR